MNVNKLSGSKVQFEVVIPVETFKKAIDDAFEKKIKEVEIPGFRKGMAPRSVYEAKFGVESLYADAVNSAIGETYYNAIVENDIQVCGYPKIDLDEKRINQEEPIHYFVTVSVYPEVTLGQYKGLEVVKDKVSVSAKEVNDMVKRALDKESMLVVKTGENVKLEKGDTAVFDFEGFVDDKAFEGGSAKDYQLEIGSNNFIPGFEDQMVGMVSGEKKDLNVKFPETYHAENLKGKDAVFKVELHEIKVKEMPELDDEFVKGLKIEGVETVDAYKKHLKEHEKEHKEHHAKEKAENDLFELIVKNATLELPEDLVEEEATYQFQQVEAQAKQYGVTMETYLQIAIGGMSVEDYKNNLKENSRKQLSFKFVLKEIAKQENFAISDEDIAKKYDEIVEQYKQQKVTLDMVKAQIPESAVKEEIMTSKAYEFVLANNSFVAPTSKKEEK